MYSEKAKVFENWLENHAVSIIKNAKTRKGAYNTFANTYEAEVGGKLDKYCLAITLNSVANKKYSDCLFYVRKERDKSRDEYECPNKNDYAPIKQIEAIRDICNEYLDEINIIRSFHNYVSNEMKED